MARPRNGRHGGNMAFTPCLVCRQGGALGGGSAAAALAKQREEEAEADQARKRFGNAKSISSAQFNSNEDSAAVDHEKQVSTIQFRQHQHSCHKQTSRVSSALLNAGGQPSCCMT